MKFHLRTPNGRAPGASKVASTSMVGGGAPRASIGALCVPHTWPVQLRHLVVHEPYPWWPNYNHKYSAFLSSVSFSSELSISVICGNPQICSQLIQRADSMRILQPAAGIWSKVNLAALNLWNLHRLQVVRVSIALQYCYQFKQQTSVKYEFLVKAHFYNINLPKLHRTFLYQKFKTHI